MRFAKAMEVLFRQLGEAIYNSWLADLVLMHAEATAWTIAAPSRFIRDWVAPRYSDSIRAASGRQIEIVVGVLGGTDCRAN